MTTQGKRWQSIFRELPLQWLVMLAIVLCLPAFFWHLDTIAFIGDEGIRSLVAFEMKASGNYIVPTLNGEPYYNKPPLYNWCIIAVSSIFGEYGEWPARTTTLFFLAIYGLTVFYFTRKYFDPLTSVTLAFMLVTCGRILFWDSMLGLIDICFSWIVFLNFMILYAKGKAGQWRWMFILSYFLFSIAFLLKGLPAVVFQGLSVITALVFHHQFRQKFISADHVVGALIGIVPLAAYYIAYASQVKLDHVFDILLDQSMQRTATHHGWKETLLHIFTFPFEQIYHFLPWTLLVMVGFHPMCRKWLKSHSFVQFNFWMLVVNLPVYWMSVQVFPRYLLMFVPLVHLIGSYVFSKDKDASGVMSKVIRVIFLIMAGVAMIATIGLPLIPEASAVSFSHLVWFGLVLIMVFGFLGMLADSPRTFLWMVICLLGVRIVFNGVVLPSRAKDRTVNAIRADCRRLAEKHGEATWYLYGKTFPHEVARFYTSAYTDQVIRKVDAVKDANALYLVDRSMYPDFKGTMIDSLLTEKEQVLALMRPDALVSE